MALFPQAAPLVALLLLGSALLHGCMSAASPAVQLPPPPAEAEHEASDTSELDPPTPRTPLPEGSPRKVVRRYNYRIEFGPYAVEVDPTEGGRIVEFAVDGFNALAPKEESPEAYGSTFWPSPQSDWNWPPPPEWAAGSWAAHTEAFAITLDSAPSAKLGLQARQRLSAQIDLGAILIEYTITNRGSEARKVAAWQNSRTRRGGLTFFPSDGQTFEQSTLKLGPEEGIVWFQHDPASMKENVKAFAKGREGWLAHVQRDVVFVKVFDEVAREALAPGEGDIEIYAQGTGEFVEIEQQGPYVSLAPGESTAWPVQWLLRKLPKSIRAEAGNLALVEYVRSLVAAVKLPGSQAAPQAAE